MTYLSEAQVQQIAKDIWDLQSTKILVSYQNELSVWNETRSSEYLLIIRQVINDKQRKLLPGGLKKAAAELGILIYGQVSTQLYAHDYNATTSICFLGNERRYIDDETPALNLDCMVKAMAESAVLLRTQKIASKFPLLDY